MSEAPQSQLGDLQQQLLFLLLDGAESTLLLLETLNDGNARRLHRTLNDLYSESEIVPALRDLEEKGLVRSKHDVIEPAPEISIPEYATGRGEIAWWSLTRSGRTVAEAVA